MLKKILKIIKEYEVMENNEQRLNKGYEPFLIFTNFYNKLYGDKK